MNRNGISETLANILIVLMVIIGIAVIWSILSPYVDQPISQPPESNLNCLSDIAKAVCLDSNMTWQPPLISGNYLIFNCLTASNRTAIIDFTPEEISWCEGSR